MEYTDRFRFATLGPGDAIADNGYKFSDADRRLLDRLLEHALEHHVHDGASSADNTPTAGPALELHTAGGTIPASTRAHYRYTLVDPAGNETGPSPLAYLDTPGIVADPAAPAVSYVADGGALLPGSYGYLLTAYSGASTLETRAGAPALLRVNVNTSTSVITLILPSVPSGADGFNVYRKKPGASRFYYLATTSDATFIDDGSLIDDSTRTLPVTNTTNNTNAVTVSLPGATPSVPEGFTWKLYRSYNAVDWTVSGLKHIVETVTETGGPVVTSFDDIGEPTSLGAPPDSSQTFGSPPKIVLTNLAHVTGALPPGANVIPQLVRIDVPGPVVEGPVVQTWICEFDQADIIWCRAFLQGLGSAPATQDLIVDVNRYNASASTWDTIYTTSANRPTITVGDQLGATAVPDQQHLVSGDVLSFDIDQAGGGATPTDRNLVIDLFLYTQSGSIDTTYVFAL